ncbi:MAG: hypothetical protein IKE42_01355 [Aquamicrobium sp.]|jgi:hypothetical protein|uniref:hypothetical protein n=1 Tax=Mesorhizobium sp. Pch-S TaxID=2082387 RepID=UPI0010126CB4|nr:hypothetical protein [Mesorhizobium sp. Pch-S]MBR2686471.1 hypothetical protein [Aquamicrobium sp.]QAZ44657.1 hypothetical protein C1M53_18630 [Mesorhizobium sp. Pch-S]
MIVCLRDDGIGMIAAATMGAAMRLFPRLLSAGLFLVGAGGLAFAEQQPAPVPFAGGTFTITTGNDEEAEKNTVLTYEGKEIARDAYVSFNRIAKIGDIDVALFYLGNGGVGCEDKPLILWKPQGATELQSAMADKDECGQLSMAVGDYAIYFIPSIMPDDPKNLLFWTPEDGLRTGARISFIPEPGTSWDDFELSGDRGIIHAFNNEAVYRAAEKLLGDQLRDVADSLAITTKAQKTRSGIFYGDGNKPHLSSMGRAFMAVDAKNRKLYIAWKSDESELRTWPTLKDWPQEVEEELEKAGLENQ